MMMICKRREAAASLVSRVTHARCEAKKQQAGQEKKRERGHGSPHVIARPAALASPLLPSAATPALALVFLSSCSHLITTKFDIVPEVVEFDIVH